MNDAGSSASRSPQASSGDVSRRMSLQRTSDTHAEVALRRELHRRGLRFRLNRVPVAGIRCRPDVVFGPARVAVFVDGCFWHGCPEHKSWPKANSEWWRHKIEGNRRRDQEQAARLAGAGWLAIRVWEHEEPEAAARRVEAAVRMRARDRRPRRTPPLP